MHSNKMTCSSFLSLHEFLVNSSENFILPRKPFKQNARDEEIRELMGLTLTDEEYEELKESCSIEKMEGLNNEMKPKENSTTDYTVFKPLFQPYPITPESLKFKTVERLKALTDKTKHSFRKWLKYCSEKYPLTPVETLDDPDLKPGSELTIRIRVYHPFKYIPGVKNSRIPKFYHDLVVLGNDTLDVLRDKLLCSNDLACNVDISNNPEAGTQVEIMEKFKSGFLFIHDTFYNDYRNSNNFDYSECIREWAKNKPELGPFKTAKMEETTFFQLQFKLGYPQVYQHLGDCEHLFTFSDVEVLQPSDNCHSSSYPMYKTVSMRKARYCTMCSIYVAKWKVEGSERVPFDPAYFCDTCFYSYNYIDGKKVGDFKAYLYYDSVVAL